MALQATSAGARRGDSRAEEGVELGQRLDGITVGDGSFLRHLPEDVEALAPGDIYFAKGDDAAISALTAAKAQLQGMITGLTDVQAWAMLGATPMIGQNDVESEVFTLADAEMLVSFAKEKHLGLISFWSLNRDRAGDGPLASFSKAQQTDFAFHDIFKKVAE